MQAAIRVIQPTLFDYGGVGGAPATSSDGRGLARCRASASPNGKDMHFERHRIGAQA